MKKHVNLLAERWAERRSKLDKETQEQLNEFFKKPIEEYQVNTIKRSRKFPELGDVFVVSPRENVYFYGKVMEADIKTINSDSFVDGQYVVLISKCHTNQLSLEDYAPDYNDLLIEPSIVSRGYWTRGLFYTLGNIPLTEEEKQLDIGFYKTRYIGNYFCRSTGEKLDEEPKLLGIHGITTYTGIASAIGRELIINPIY